MTRVLLVLLLAAMLHAARRADAQTTVSGRITYVTSTAAYVNLGTNQGLDVGDTLHVRRGGKSVGTLVVATIASKSLSATIVDKTEALLEGDDAHAVTTRTPREPARQVVPDTVAPVAKVSSSPPAQVQPQPVPANAVHGRVGVQYYGMFNDASSALDFSQPGMVLNVTVERILDAPLQFSYYGNSRYDAAQQRTTAASDPRLNNRIYEAVFRYGDDRMPFAASLGRFVAYQVGGVGTFDGAMVTYRRDRFQFGAAAGTQPGWQRSELQLTDPKFAAFAAYEAGDYSSARIQSSVAYAQQYYQRKLDRGFFYIQNILSFSNSLSIYQNANIDVHDLVDGARTTSLHLTDFMVSASYRPATWIATSGSYAIRRNIFFLSSFSGIPDSLFDRSKQQNSQVSLSFRLPMTMYLTATGSLRAREGDRSATSIFVNYNWADILGTRVGAYVTGSAADNVYNTSSSVGLDVHTDLIDDLYLAVKGQWHRYDFTSFTRRIHRSSYGIDAYYRISRSLYASLSFERYIETSLQTNRIYGEVTVRF